MLSADVEMQSTPFCSHFTPRVSLRAETGSRKMKYRIWKLKVLLVMRIRMQERSLAKAIHEEQVAMGWPGLAKEVEQICKEIGVKDANKEMVRKEELEEAVAYADYKEMKEEMNKYVKLQEVKDSDMRQEQDYMHEKAVDKATKAFRLRTKMTKCVKMNYKNLYKGNLKCDKCESGDEDTQEHLMVCMGWEEERGSLDMLRIMDQVEFITRVEKVKVMK